MTKYLWVDSIAEKWGVSKSWVYRLCRDGRVSGAFFSEGRWAIPEDAEKPIDYRVHKRYVKALAGSKRMALPSCMPLKFPGEPDGIPDDVDKVVSECADYVLDLIDVHPASGRLLFSALSYEHINAQVVCENLSQYSYLAAMCEYVDEVYADFTMLAFEYSMLTPDRRKAYFDEKKRLFNGEADLCAYERAAYLLFFAGTNSQRVVDIDPESGEVRSEYKKNGTANFASKEEIYLISSLLQRAEIYPDEETARSEMRYSEYSALHLSEKQYEEKKFDDIEKKVERLIII